MRWPHAAVDDRLWPLEWAPIVLIIVPILLPLLEKLEVNFLWFGILVAVNLQTAWQSPPVALSAYFLKAVVTESDVKDIYLGKMQLMVIQLIGLIVIFNIPQIALGLPSQVIYNQKRRYGAGGFCSTTGIALAGEAAINLAGSGCDAGNETDE